MTYKLYTAYRLPYDGTVLGMKKISKSLREDITVILHKDMLQERLAGAALSYDKVTLLTADKEKFGGLKLPENYSSNYSAWFNEMAEHRGANMEEEERVPYVTLLVDEQTPEWLYLIPRNIPINSLDTLLLSDTYNAEEYGYWNNSEHPEEITKEEWDSRKETWERMGVWKESVEECGWGVHIIAGFMLRGMVWNSSDEEATPLIPSLEDRTRSLTVDILQSKLAQEVNEKYSAEGDLSEDRKEARFHEVIKAITSAVYMVMDGHPDAVTLSSEISGKLVKDLTMEELRKD